MIKLSIKSNQNLELFFGKDENRNKPQEITFSKIIHKSGTCSIF